MPNNKIIRNDDGKEILELLDLLGATEDMRQEHQKHGKENELLQTFTENVLMDLSVNAFVFGSTSEGTLLQKLYISDIDCLICNNSHPVITSLDESTPGVLCFMMIHDKNQTPGYVKLQPFVNKQAITEHSAHMYHLNTCKTDGKGRLCLDAETAYTNFCYHKSKYFTKKHGPAYTVQSHLDGPTDIVPAFRCASVPFFCSSWISHYKNCVWPSKALIENLIKLGCFVVPAGHILSPQPDLEWRVSFSLQERQIMFSLTPVQHKCYVFLKAGKHKVISTNVSDAISSYHLKTSIFHLKTITAEGFWSENNFCICIRMCFLILLSWLHKKFCPNWFIPEQNLFEKLTKCERNILRKLLYSLVFMAGFRHLLVNPLELIIILNLFPPDQRLLLKFRTIYDREIDRKDAYSVNPALRCRTLTEFLKRILVKMAQIPHLTSEFHSTEDCEIPKRLLSLMLKSVLMQSYGSFAWTNEEWISWITILKIQSLPLLFTETFLECFNHSKRVGMSYWDSNIILLCQEIHFRESGSYQNDRITSDTVLATVLYMSGHYIEADLILSSAESNDKKDVLTLCQCNTVPATFGFGYYGSRALNEEDILLHIAPCVIFTVRNLPTIPEALYFELIRTKLPGSLTKEFWMYNEWYFWAVVDARIYLYFLRYLVLKELNNRNNQKEAFKRLKRVIRKAEQYGSDVPILRAGRHGSDNPFDYILSHRRYMWYCLGHIETALNLLGWIYVQEGLYDAAICCFTSSWKRRRNINAAKWHLALLLFDSMI